MQETGKGDNKITEESPWTCFCFLGLFSWLVVEEKTNIFPRFHSIFTDFRFADRNQAIARQSVF